MPLEVMTKLPGELSKAARDSDEMGVRQDFYRIPFPNDALRYLTCAVLGRTVSSPEVMRR